MKLVYHNSTVTAPVVLTLPGCAAVCPLASWRQLTHSLTPHHWQEECEEGPSEVGELGLPLMIVCIVLLALAFVYLARFLLL